MEPEKKPAAEKKPDIKEKPVVEKKGDKPAPVSSKPQSPLMTLIIVAVVLIVLLTAAIGMGLLAERRFGNYVLQTLPKNITSKWAGDSIQIPAENKTDPGNPTVSVLHTPRPTVTSTVLEELPPSDQGATESGFILDFSNTRKVASGDLTGLTPWELKVARNEIYARHGRPFVHKDLSCYFAQQPWYTINPAFKENQLSALEVANAVFILNFERDSQSPLVDKDSGCNSQL